MQYDYKTLKSSSVGDYREKGSKFLAYAYPVANEEEIKERLEGLKKDHPKSRHVCYAYRLDLEGNDFRANDDGEPSGTAGKPILGQIDSFELTKTLVAVVRYFGGKKLGASGLINAYKTSAALALGNAEIKVIKLKAYHQIAYKNERLNDIMRHLKHDEIKIVNQHYGDTCTLDFSVSLAVNDMILDKLSKIYDISLKPIDANE